MGSRFGYSHIFIVGKGSMAARCGAILLAAGFEVDEVWESGAEPFSSLPGFSRAYRLGYFKDILEIGRAVVSLWRTNSNKNNLSVAYTFSCICSKAKTT